VDQLRFFFGEAESVFAVCGRTLICPDEFPSELPKYDTDDFSTALITFKSGVVAVFMAGVYLKQWTAWENKMLFGARDTRMEYGLLSHATIYGPGEDQKEVYQAFNNAGLDCDRTFIDAAISGDGSKILSPYSDAVKSLAFALATTESARTGKAVKVEDLLK
jgi:predicted dehydrogenase